MKTLPTEFQGRADQRGYVFKQLKRTGDVALFEKHNPSHPPGTALSYEVVIVQKRPERTFPNGEVYPAHESMPSPEEWGVYGWSPYDLEAALAKLDLVVSGQAQMAVPTPTEPQNTRPEEKP